MDLCATTEPSQLCVFHIKDPQQTAKTKEGYWTNNFFQNMNVEDHPCVNLGIHRLQVNVGAHLSSNFLFFFLFLWLGIRRNDVSHFQLGQHFQPAFPSDPSSSL